MGILRRFHIVRYWLALGLVLQGPGLMLPQLGYAQSSSNDTPKADRPAVAPVAVEAGTVEISNNSQERLYEVTDAKGETSLIKLQESPKEEIEKFSPEKLGAMLAEMRRESQSEGQRIANSVQTELSALTKLLVQHQAEGRNAVTAKQLYTSIDYLAKSELQKMSVIEIERAVREIKYYASTSHKLKPALQFEIMKSLTRLQKNLARTGHDQNQREKMLALPKGLVIQTALRFPMESLLFNAAMGMVMAIQLSARYQENPLGIQQTLESLQTPEGHLGFFAFMLANGAVSPHLNRMITKPWARPMIPYLGMTAGMMASNLTHDAYNLVFHTGLVKCALGQLGDYSKEETDKACASAYKELAVDRKILQYGGGVASLLLATAASGMAQKVVSRGATGASKVFTTVAGKAIPSSRVFALTGVSVLARLNSFGWVLTAGHLIGKVAQFTGFVGIDTMIHPTIMRVSGNLWTGSLLAATETQIIQNLSEEAPKYNGRSYSELCKAEGAQGRKARRDHDCRSLLTALKIYGHHMESWQTMLTEKASSSHYSWLDKTNQVIAMYSAAEEFYADVIGHLESRRSLGEDGLTLNPLDRKMPLNGVIPHGLIPELSVLYTLDMDSILMLRLISLQKSLHYMDGFIQGSELAKSAPAALDKLKSFHQSLKTEWTFFEDADQQQLRRYIWQKHLAELDALIAQDPQAASLLAPLKKMGLGFRGNNEIPLRISYSLKPYLTGLIAGSERAFRSPEDLVLFKNLRAKLSLNGNTEQGDQIASAVILQRVLSADPSMKDEVTQAEFKLADSDVAAQHFEAIKLNPESYFSSYVAKVSELRNLFLSYSRHGSVPTSRVAYQREARQVLNLLGAPRPMMEPGRGYLESYYAANSALQDVAPPLRPGYLGEKVTDFMAYAMVCGPDVEAGENSFQLNMGGFSDWFYPPRISKPEHKKTLTAICNREFERSVDHQYAEVIPNVYGPRKSIVTGVLEYLKSHTRPEVFKEHQDSGGEPSNWWAAKLLEELKLSYLKWASEYQKFVAQMVADILSQGQEKTNIGNMSNGLLEAMTQRRRLYIGILGEMAKLNLQNFSSSRATLPMARTDSLFLDLLQGPIFDLSTWASSVTAASQSFAFQTELEKSLGTFDEHYQNIRVEFSDRPGTLGSLVDLVKLKNVSRLERGFTHDEIQNTAAQTEEVLENIALSFGMEFDGVAYAPVVVESPYSAYQLGIINEALIGLRDVRQQYVTVSNIMTALDAPDGL